MTMLMSLKCKCDNSLCRDQSCVVATVRKGLQTSSLDYDYVSIACGEGPLRSQHKRAIHRGMW